jgi:hypothetical protein
MGGVMTDDYDPPHQLEEGQEGAFVPAASRDDGVGGVQDIGDELPRQPAVYLHPHAVRVRHLVDLSYPAAADDDFRPPPALSFDLMPSTNRPSCPIITISDQQTANDALLQQETSKTSHPL